MDRAKNSRAYVLIESTPATTLSLTRHVVNNIPGFIRATQRNGLVHY